MFGSSVLEVAIGLVFVFLLVSMLVTAASELLASWWNSRAKFLQRGVQALLEPDERAGTVGGLTASLFQHPLIRALTPPASAGGAAGSVPSYIPAPIFSTAVLHMAGLLRQNGGDWLKQLEARLAGLPAAGGTLEQVRAAVGGLTRDLGAALDGAQLKSDLAQVSAALAGGAGNPSREREHLAELQANLSGGLSWVKQPLSILATAPTVDGLAALMAQIPSAGPAEAALQSRLEDWLKTLAANPTDYTTALAQIRSFAASVTSNETHAALMRLPEGHFKKSLLALFADAEGQFDQFQSNVQAWFEMGMDRVTGWYKRHTVAVNFAVAAIVVVFMNVDALLIVRRLSSDPALRNALVAEAQSTAAQPPPGGGTKGFEAVSQRLQGLALPIGWTIAEKPASGPAGNEYRTLPPLSALGDSAAWSGLGDTAAAHLLGWLLTAVAASLGAPFWFDLLDNLMNIRNAGCRPARKASDDDSPGA